MYCSNCGNKVEGTPFCPYCGTKLQATGSCRYCGKEITGTPYCPHCGKMQNVSTYSSYRRQPDNDLWIKLIIAGAVVLILLACLALVGDKKKSAGDKPEKEPVITVATTAPAPDIISKEKPEATQSPADTRAEQYAEAVRLYEKRDYLPAQLLFESLSDYGDSQKYLRLIRIRFSGTNIGVGSKVYRAECGLTEHQKRDIDKAAADFYFADTAEVLVCNSDVASYYLIGEWNGGSKCYIHFIANNYGCRYNIGSKLSTNYQDTFGIYDGILYVDVVDSWAKTLKLTLLSPDCMEVYTYEKGGKTYTLTRE